MKVTSLLVSAAILLASIGFTSSVRAGTLTISANTTGSNTASFALATGVGSALKRQFDSQTSTSGGGPLIETIGATVAATARYAAITVADLDSVNSSTPDTGVVTSSYSVTVGYTPTLPGVVYDLEIDTSRIGAFTIVNDTSNRNGELSLSGVTGLIDGNPNAGLNLAAVASLASTASTNVPFSQANTLLLTGLTGPQSFVLNFTWTSRARSVSDSFTASASEAAVRLGLAGTLSGISADDYPGVGSRNQAGDGHFVNATVSITAVPEPSSIVLGLMAGTGLALCAWRRRRAA